MNNLHDLHDYTVHQYYQPLYYPTNALTCIKSMVIKNEKYKNCSDMFRFTQEPSSVSKCQYLAKITDMVRRCLSIRMWSVLPCRKGLSLTVPSYTVHYTHAQQARICRHNTDHIRMDKHRRTIFVILARY